MRAKIKTLFWIGFILLLIVILMIAGKRQHESLVKTPIVPIKVEADNAFLTEDELVTRLRRSGLIFPGQRMFQLNTTAIEKYVSKMQEVEEVNVFKRYDGNWEIEVKIRQAIARVFNKRGESFYLDSKGVKMQTSPNFTARVLVFSGHINDVFDSLEVSDIINKPSLKTSKNLDEIYRISNYVCNDPFLRAQIGQVYRNQWGDFVMIPQVGNHEIVFGRANSKEEVEEKMTKLKRFYKYALPYEGWEKYESISLKFKNQVVAKKRKKETEPE